ncbi:cell division protein FtsQ/DivIB [Bacillus mesophilum]|uniref:Cell division protein DivIB n=1 Tax=Bacillus mesophilum TaxID=1071718 RepID=A0A7V7RPS1_9BACI|nr:FtsQ-type POTRA domain-containing protein [Bacillus mesophilum]KAB2335326.1 FtsQ-type POTRA domain-containing protein [Bacillus mesophilum]
MSNGKLVSLEDRIPKLKQQRKKKANRRLIFLLILFFILIVFVIYFQSPLSHVKEIEVKGNTIYSSAEIIENSGVSQATNIWEIDEQEIEEKLKAMSEVKNVQVTTSLPSTVNIVVDELRRIAYIMNGETYKPVLENGKTIQGQAGEIPANAPILIGFDEGEVLDLMIQELEVLPVEIQNSISEVHYTPKETDRFHVQLFMNDGFEVSATLRSFSEKMAHYPSIVSQLDTNQKGIIDLEVGSYFRAFEEEGAEKVDEETEGEG